MSHKTNFTAAAVSAAEHSGTSLWLPSLSSTDSTPPCGRRRLERRSVTSDLIETFKITKGMYDVNKEIFKTG